MTFFRRLRRLRRPIAVLLLSCAMFALVPPSPSRALAPIAVVALNALRVVGTRGATMLARSGSWARVAGGLRTALGSWKMAGATTAIGFRNEIVQGAQNLWKWIKSHPGDAADIAGTVLDLIQALRGNGNDKLADAVEHALQPKTTSSGPGENVGDLVEQCDGVYRLTSKSLYWRSCCAGYETYDKNNCTYREILKEVSNEACDSPCSPPRGPMERWHYYYKKVSDAQTPSPDSNNIPEELTDEQADRLLNKIEELLRDHKEEMEKDLDDLIKKNLEDIDWPEFDNDAAKQYLRDNKRDDLLDELEKTEQELERKRQELENNQNDPECNNQQDCQNDCNDQTNCQSKCCTTVDCEESRLENKIDRLKDKLDDLDKEEQKENLDETYEAPPPAETELKSIDFQPIVDLKGEFMTKFPFNTLQLIPSAVQLLAAEPQAPSFVIDLGDVGGQHTVDFSVFDSLASFVRLTLTFLIYLAAVFCCLKIWSRL